MALEQKSMAELRTIAQSLGIDNIFQKDRLILTQDISLASGASTKEPKVTLPERNKYDARLMTASPNEMLTEETARDILKEHIERGLRFSVTDNIWIMSFRKKTDTGTMHMPLRHLLNCADKVLS